MDPIALTPIDISLGLLAAALLGGLAGYLVRLLQERRRAEPPLRLQRTTAGGGARPPDAPGVARGLEAWKGLRKTEPSAEAESSKPRDPWHHQLPLDVEESVRSAGTAEHQPTVLVVDDRMELRAIHGAYLRQHGYHVITAADGETALRMVRAHRPAVVLLDHSLPGLTGIEVTRELKADPRTSRIPIILMTAHSYGAIGMAARQAGVAAFLPKPVDPSRVLREIERHARVDVHDA